MVILATVVAGGLAAIGRFAEAPAELAGKAGMFGGVGLLTDEQFVRIVVGGFLTAALLGIGTEFAPAVAGNLAALMLTTSVFVLAAPAWNALSRLTTKEAS